jgi:nucleoside-diphosphate-sugar epimerase
MSNILIADAAMSAARSRARAPRAATTCSACGAIPVDIPSGVVAIAGRSRVPRSLAELPGALDVVVYAASPGGRDDAFYRTAYVEGLRNLIAALSAQGQEPRRTIFVSSTAVYGQTRGEWVDEDVGDEARALLGPPAARGRSRLLRESGLPGVVLRLGGIYGPRRARLVDEVRQGRPRSRAAVPATPTASTATTAWARSIT